MNVFELFGVLKLNKDEYEKDLSTAEKSSSTAGETISKALGVASKAVVAGVTASATAITAVVKQSTEAYASYEQLVGGVETLFGAGGKSLTDYAGHIGVIEQEVRDSYNKMMDAQNTVLANASNAYKTAGMSANEYMETVTSFSASLIASLDGDTQKASEKADQAIIQMADNANKMGTDISSIQNAYQGFAKQNYTMLDNLKLGYGGTKEEMQRLLEEAGKISGITYDISSYADIVDAIKVVQDEMGITGTTAKEASVTIEGSLNSMKASWTNLITGLGDKDADMGALIVQFAESVSTYAGNLIPVVEQAIGGVGTVIETLLPKVMSEVPKIINDVLPKLLKSGTNMVSAIIRGIKENSGEIIEGAMSIVNLLAGSVIELLPQIIELGWELVLGLVQGMTEELPAIAEMIVTMFGDMGENIQANLPAFIENALVIIQSFATALLENSQTIIQAGVELLMALTNGIVDSLPVLIEMLPTIITTFAEVINSNMPTIISTGIQIIVALVEGIIACIPVIAENIPQIIQAIVSVFEAFNWLNLGKNIMTLFKNGITGMKSAVAEAGKSLIDNLKGGFKNLPSAFAEFGKQAVLGLVNGIKNNIWQAVQTAVSAVTSVVSGVKHSLGIASPSKVFKEIGKYMVEGMEVGWDDNIAEARKTILGDLDFSAVPAKIALSGDYANGGTIYNQTININREISTADQLAREIRTESRYGLMVGA